MASDSRVQSLTERKSRQELRAVSHILATVESRQKHVCPVCLLAAVPALLPFLLCTVQGLAHEKVCSTVTLLASVKTNPPQANLI